MAVRLGGGGAGYRGAGGGRFRYKPMSEINVTPFVDVMLVLLIIFMVTAPMLTVGVPVDLPKTQAKPIGESDEPLVITINKEGKIFLQETEITIESLVPRLEAITENKAETRIFIRGDKDLPYGRIMEIMATATTAGFTKVALITDFGGKDRKKAAGGGTRGRGESGEAAKSGKPSR